MSINKHRT